MANRLKKMYNLVIDTLSNLYNQYIKIDTIKDEEESHPVLIKINHLIDNIDNIDLYNFKYRSKHITSIEDDIVKYNKYLNMLHTFDKDNKYLSVKNISFDTGVRLELSYWYTDNGSIISNNDVLKSWLEYSLSFIVWYNNSIIYRGNNTSFTNAKYLQPYCKNITDIVEIIYELYLT